MLRCRPTRVVLKQEDMQEYESRRDEWIAAKASAEGRSDRAVEEDAANLMNAVRRQTRRGRLGLDGKA